MTCLLIFASAALYPACMMAEMETGAERETASAIVAGSIASADESRLSAIGPTREPLLVIGFMDGRIHAGNLAHGEARLARDLDQRYPQSVHAITFANQIGRASCRERG